ncbi:MAG: ribosome recycling factor [Patescibacteria group bacterium]
MTYHLLPAESIIRALREELTRVRTGRVTPSLVENLEVEAYGSMMGLMTLAQITNPEPRTIIITPYDRGMISAIAKVIEESRLGVNPTDNGAGVILNFPPMTEENRRNQVKVVDSVEEKIKIMVRQNRQDVLTKREKEMKAENASEDAVKGFKADLQKEVDALNAEIELICDQKRDDVMKI